MLDSAAKATNPDVGGLKLSMEQISLSNLAWYRCGYLFHEPESR